MEGYSVTDFLTRKGQVLDRLNTVQGAIGLRFANRRAARLALNRLHSMSAGALLATLGPDQRGLPRNGRG